MLFLKHKKNDVEKRTGDKNEYPQLYKDDASEGETTLLSYESEYTDESETTLLNSTVGDTLIAEELGKTSEDSVDGEEYEGQTSLLSREYSPYIYYEQSDNQLSNHKKKILSEKKEEQDDNDQGETTLLSYQDECISQGMNIPDSAPKAYLIRIIQSKKIYINKIKFIVGSDSTCVDCVIDNATISRQHAFVIYNDSEYYLMDNHSTNKTLLDGIVVEPLKSVKLYHGALIQFSEELFQFVIEKINK